MELKLVSENDPILFKPAEPWDFTNPPHDPFELAHAMYDLMNESGGIGLAAPQVGIPYRMFVLRSEPKLAIFNPKIVWSSPQEIEMEEGCLSFPGLGIKVFRPESIRARFMNPNGTTEAHVFKGLTARVFQHEADHLDGICFTSKVSKLKLDMYKRKRKKLAKDLESGKVMLRADYEALLAAQRGTETPRPYNPDDTSTRSLPDPSLFGIKQVI
jgi:peptide deformylase